MFNYFITLFLTVYFSQGDNFATWCSENELDLNVTKTKEMLFDFRKDPPAVASLVVNGEPVERVNEYRYLGTVVDDRLTFEGNVISINKRCQSRIFCLQKLRNIGVNSEVLHQYYRSCIESLLTASFICWYGSLSLRCKNMLNDVVNVCSKVVGVKEESMQDLYECRVVRKARLISEDESHVLAKHYEVLPSGRRFRTVRAKARAQKTFIPRSIHLLNS